MSGTIDAGSLRAASEPAPDGLTPLVILLHGLGADHRAFQRFVRLLPAAWDVAMIDLLGHGDAPHPEAGYSLDDHGSYIACRLEALDAGRRACVLVGHSYGAAAAVATAARRPELMRGIVLLDAIVPDPAGPGETATRRMMRARREGTLAQVVPELFAHESAALQRWIVDTWQRMATGVVDEFDNDWPAHAGVVGVPVEVIHGDVELGGGGAAPAMHFPDAGVRRIEGAGHYLHATHARETAAAVVEAVDDILAMSGQAR